MANFKTIRAAAASRGFACGTRPNFMHSYCWTICWNTLMEWRLI